MTAVLAGAGVAAAPLIWAATADGSGPRSYGSGVATSLAAQPATPSVARSVAPSVPPTAAPSTRTVAAPPATPTSVFVPGLDLRAAVTPVGVDASGAVAVPEDVRNVGWYRWSAPVGSSQGSTVLVGHVDSAEQGAGAFFRLDDVRVDTRIEVGSGDGRRFTYRVVAMQAYAKDEVPLGALFSAAGSPRLTLITCGGSFDAQRHSYRDNVVVTAVPADAGR